MLSHRGSGKGAPATAPRGEAGETLIEVLVSVMLMGTVVAAILGGLFALVTVSDNNNERTKVSVAVQTYAEQIKQPVEELQYIPCGTAAEYQNEIDALLGPDVLPNGYTASLTVSYWDGGGVGFGACPATTTDDDGTVRDRGLQRFAITVANSRTGSSAASETLVVYKRDARCPEPLDYDNTDAGPC